MAADHLDVICIDRDESWSLPGSVRRVLGPRLADRSRRIRQIAVLALGAVAQRQGEAEVPALRLRRHQSFRIAVGADTHYRIDFQ